MDIREAKEIIDKMRAVGKGREKIEKAFEDAAVKNINTMPLMQYIKERSESKPISLGDAAAGLAHAFGAFGLLMEGFRESINDAGEGKTNNWRKMHGLPLKRRGGKRK